MLLGMTHEEAAVHLARSEAKSYLKYPFMIYQILTKFRDALSRTYVSAIFSGFRFSRQLVSPLPLTCHLLHRLLQLHFWHLLPEGALHGLRSLVY